MSVDIALVTMPWSSLQFPSIQLGTLKAIIERAGCSTVTHYFNLDFAEQAIAATHGLPEAEQVTIELLGNIGNRRYLGDWLFAVPPFRTADPDADRRFLASTTDVDERTAACFAPIREMIPRFLESCIDKVLASAPRAIGFTSSFNQNVASLSLAKLLKIQAPHVPIIFGGANCEGEMGQALHRLFPSVDLVVRGEAEAVIGPIIADIVAGRPIGDYPGICVRRGGVSIAVPAGADSVAMDDVPMPDYDEFFERLEASPLATDLSRDIRLLYESARGCWWGAKNHCTFCGLNGASMRFRSKSADRAFAEMTALSERHRTVQFQVVDNIIEMRYLSELLPRLRETGWNWNVFYETKANLKKPQLRQFRVSGVRTIQPGIESLSSSILKRMNKGVTALQNIRLLKWCAELGIAPVWNMIFGFPGEDEREYQRMADLIPSLVHLDAPSVVPLAFDRFSPYHSDPAHHGLEIVGPHAAYLEIYPFPAHELTALAYTFEARYVDGRTPRSYAQPLIEAVEHWRRDQHPYALAYERGPGFIVIDDHRRAETATRYTLEHDEALIYLACDAGATPTQVRAAMVAQGTDSYSDDEIRGFLGGLVESRLVYEERGRYLALAIDRDPLRALEGDSHAGEDDADAEPAANLIALGRKRAS